MMPTDETNRDWAHALMTAVEAHFPLPDHEWREWPCVPDVNVVCEWLSDLIATVRADESAACAEICDQTACEYRSLEEHKQKALAAIEHMSGLGKLLRIVEIDWEGDPDAVAQGIDDANAGLQAAGDLIVMLSDLAYHEIERLDQALNRKPVDS